MCNDSRGSKAVSFSAGAALGGLIGAGLGFFMSTKKGKKYAKQVWKKVEPYIDDAREGVEDAAVKGRDAIDDAVSQVKVPEKLKKPIKKAFFKGL